MAGWDDSQKFWAETWRTLILGGIGAVIATLVLGNLSDEARFQRENRVKALDNFIYKSSAYTAVAADFCRSANQEVETKFKFQTVDDYHVSAGALKIYYQDPDLDKKFDEAKKREITLFKFCNTGATKAYRERMGA